MNVISAEIVPKLLAWYAEHARELAWRVGPRARAEGVRADPYRVWLAEIMLQQTTVPHGTPYYLAFTERWPQVEDLAAARDDDVMAAWAGLGYYARARNLLKCARKVVERGGFPETQSELLKLPGVGPYTAAAIAALAFNQPAAAVDGNVERVFSRLMALEMPLKTAKGEIRRAVEQLVPVDRPAQFAEGLMDLGATICTPRRPNCLICPLSSDCAARAGGSPEHYPIKPAKSTKPHRTGHVFLLLDRGELMLERRPQKGLLGGMLGLPGSEWREGEASQPTGAPASADWQARGEVRHVFTHFSLSLTVWQGILADPQRPQAEWVAVDKVTGLPSVFAKAVRQLDRALC